MKIKNLILLMLLALLWGPSFMFIKVAVVEIAPLSLAALRIGIAAIILHVYLFFKKTTFQKSWIFWKHVTIAGFFAHGLPFTLISWGEVFIDSSLASILNGLTPVATIIIAHFSTFDDKLTPHKVVGVAISIIGVIVLVSPHFSMEMKSSFDGVVAVIIASISYAVGIVYARLHLRNTPSVHAPASQLLVTSLYLVPMGFFIDGVFNPFAVSWEALASVGILAVFGTAIAFVLYYRLLASSSASYLSMVTYVMPVIGIALGIIFLGEQISSSTLLGGTVILIGVMIAVGTLRIPLPWARTVSE